MTRYSKQADALNRCRSTRQLLHRVWPPSFRSTLSPLGKVRFRLDERKVADLVAAYESGVTGDQVGLDFGVSRWTVHRLVRERGGVVRPRAAQPGRVQ
jgi:hypothetical protein